MSYLTLAHRALERMPLNVDAADAVWKFERLEIPSQIRVGCIDVWMVGKRQDKSGFMFWFVKQEKTAHAN